MDLDNPKNIARILGRVVGPLQQRTSEKLDFLKFVKHGASWMGSTREAGIVRSVTQNVLFLIVVYSVITFHTTLSVSQFAVSVSLSGEA